MTTSVAIGRSSLGLGDLVIQAAPSDATYLLLRDGLMRPAMTWRITSMPDSQDVHGSEPISAVKEQTSLPLRIEVQADSSAALDAAITALDDALSQFAYTVTQTIDGVVKTWSASSGSWATGGPTSRASVVAHYEVLTITIPIYPIPGV